MDYRQEEGQDVPARGYVPQDRPSCLAGPPLKAPRGRPLIAIILEAYGRKPPTIAPVEITDAMADTLARRLLGATGPGGVDLVRIQHWLMRFGVASMGLRQSFGEFGDQMANGQPPWAAYMALVFGRLIGLDN